MSPVRLSELEADREPIMDSFGSMIRRVVWSGTLILLCAATECQSALAQKAPEVGYVLPAGVQSGAATDVRFGGYDWTPDLQFFVSDPRIKLEVLGPPGEIMIPPPPYWFGPKAMQGGLPLSREMPVRLTVPADIPPGPIRWQVANANGGSTHGVFYVGAGPHVVEQDRRNGAQALPALPVMVCGRLDRIEDVDRYRFNVEQAGPVTIELFARRLGSNFNAILEVRDSAGTLIADAADTQGYDAAMTFSAEVGHEYQVRLFDVDFRGDSSYVYRLEFRRGPRIVAARPAGGRRGETRDVEFIGYGVASGAAQLERVTRPVAFPADPALAALDYVLDTPFGQAGYSFPLGNLPEQLEPAAASAAHKIDAPQAITGVLEQRDVPDTYELTLAKGEMRTFSAQARRFGLPLDLTLALIGPDGKEIARNDDPAPGIADPVLSFTSPADGVYRLLVIDSSGKSGTPAAIYRLLVEQPAAGFSLRTLELLNVTIGGKAELQVTAVRTGGFAGPITLSVAGLPDGVKPTGELVIPADKVELKIPLESAADAPSLATLVTVTGTAIVGEQSVSRVALAPASGNLAPRFAEENLLPTVLVTSVMKRRCRVAPVDKDGGRTVHRGTTFPADVIVERLEGFSGEVELQMAGRQTYHQQGIRGFDVVVPPGVTRTAYPCFMPEWLETSRTSRMIANGLTKVPDSRGNVRWLISAMEGRITFSVEGALLKLSHGVNEMTIAPGQTFDVPLKIARSAKLPQAVTLALEIPPELAGAVSAQSIVIPANQSEATLRIVTTNDPRLLGEQSLTIRATALQSGYLPVVSETSFEFDVQAGADAK